MYLIRGLSPRRDISMGAHGFAIELSPEWPTLVAASGLTEEQVRGKIANLGNDWLDACGYNGMYDPDAPFDVNQVIWPRPRKLGPRATRQYEASRSIRVQWGPWGLEHISVPGNACGLDIDDHSFGTFIEGARMLTPHNIDSAMQKMLLLIVFTSFAEDIVLFSRKLNG